VTHGRFNIDKILSPKDSTLVKHELMVSSTEEYVVKHI